MRKPLSLILNFTLLASIAVNAQITERPRPENWKQLVNGAAFKDRFLPMQGDQLSSNTWGGNNVLPRLTDNGIEDTIRSYWGGNIIKDKDGLYHLFVCGWPENSPKGHHEWPRSTVYHTTSKNAYGPFKIKDTIGKGHNPEVFQLNDGRLVLYVIDANYISPGPDGPWVKGKFEFDPRDRRIIEGLSNLTFTKRTDGSFLMICRGGGSWISETGTSTYKQISNKRAYPDIKGEFEDPVIWKDNVQYNLIVNDWLGRIAFYQRSKDGVNWVTDPGEAYIPGIAFHSDGQKEDWFKYERIKILQDKYGRAIQANFAVIDTLKDEDKANDRHSSKNISIPLNTGVLITMQNKDFASTKNTIKIKVLAEPGFNPQKDIDFSSLRFGSSSEVNFGKGSKVTGTTKSSKDIIISFDGPTSGLNADEFAPKLIGKYKTGKLLFGYCRVPWIEYDGALLSAKKPSFMITGDRVSIEIPVENFGLASSKNSQLQLRYKKGSSNATLATLNIPSLKPYEKVNLSGSIKNIFETNKSYDFSIVILINGKEESVFNFKDQPIK